MFRGRGRGSGRGRRNYFQRRPRKHISIRDSSGPADKTIAELEKYYFDCTSFNEADRFINTKEKIIQYLGVKYGGDVRTSLTNGVEKEIRLPEDPVETNNYTDDVETDEDGNEVVVLKARDKCSYSESKCFDKELGEFVQRKQKLDRNL